jgi:competence protein ComEC
MPHPFLPLTAALAGGILFHRVIPIHPAVFSGLACASLISAWALFLFRRRMFPVFILILFCSFFLGAGFYSHTETAFAQNKLHNLHAENYLDLTGTLIKSPSFGIDNDYLYVKVTKIRAFRKTIPVSGKLRLTVPRTDYSLRLKKIFAGDKIQASARLNNSRGFKNFGLPGRDFYLKADHIHRQGFCKSPLLIHKISNAPPLSTQRLFSFCRMKIQSAIETYFSGPRHKLSASGAVLEALILGARDRVREDTNQILQQSGLFHLLAISGAHIAVLSLLFFSLLKVIRVPERSASLIVMIGLIFYALLVEGRPSVIRATLVMIFFLCSKLLWRDARLLNTLSISAFVLLVMYPFDLFALGFQLTFAATFSIVLLTPVIVKKLPRLPGKFSEVLAVSLAALTGVLPFIALVFNRVSFFPLILNYPALPLITVIMAGGYVFLLAAGIFPHLAANAAAVLDFIIRKFISLANLSHLAPALAFRIPDPYPWITAGYSVCLITWMLLKNKWGKRISAAGFIMFTTLLIWHPFPHHSENLRITYIDVGQGDAALIECPGHEVMLIDGGGLAASRFDIGEQVVSQVLWRKGIKRIDYLVCSHPHPDHFGGLFSVSRNFAVSEFWEAALQTDQKEYQNFLNQLSPQTLRRRLCRGDRMHAGQMVIDILHPPRRYDDANINNHSLVLRIKFRSHAFLFAGDIEKEAEMELVRSGKGISSQVLKVPHHGSESSSSDPFLQSTAPQIAVIPAGEHNRYGLPKESVVRRYHELGAAVFRTDLYGAVEITSDGSLMSVRTASSPPLEKAVSSYEIVTKSNHPER